jgi:heat shock protein HslJ
LPASEHKAKIALELNLTMPMRPSHIFRLGIAAVLAVALLLMLPPGAAWAAPATAVYRGDVAGAAGPARKIELRLKADGTMSMMTDMRNNRAPVTEEGHWNAISVEQIDLIIERKDGVAVAPDTLHFIKQGDVLRTTGDSSAQFGNQGLQLRQVKIAPPPTAALPVAGTTAGAWRWESLISSAGQMQIEQPERYTLELQNGGKALIRADCNSGQASYKLNGRNIAIKVLGMTKNACPSGSLSERFLKSLDAAVGQRLRGANLFLDLPGEDGTMIFVRAR